MANELLLSWSEWQSQLTQMHQVNDCRAVDVGFGNLLVSALAGGEPPAHKRYAAVRAFYGRDKKGWVKLSDQDDPKQFMRDLLASAAPGDKEKNPIEMPVVFFSRQLGSTVAEGDIHISQKGVDQLVDLDSQQPIGQVNLHHEELTYTVGVCAWNVPTLDYITRLLSARFRHKIRGFAFESELAGFQFPATADVMTRLLSWSPASPPAETDRLLCLTTTIEVITEAHELQGLESKEVKYRLLEPQPMFEAMR
ncbi:TPA: hypothetical protein ACRTTK_003086 [Aeromonas hydrophila]|uniref:hypothetical protein n=1 Tax=Aeromonas hydrophila TaxID=644 RepID=UPI0024415813|nr:hypothetical protein [Aeromonas hydrophila]